MSSWEDKLRQFGQSIQASGQQSIKDLQDRMRAAALAKLAAQNSMQAQPMMAPSAPTPQFEDHSKDVGELMQRIKQRDDAMTAQMNQEDAERQQQEEDTEDPDKYKPFQRLKKAVRPDQD